MNKILLSFLLTLAFFFLLWSSLSYPVRDENLIKQEPGDKLDKIYLDLGDLPSELVNNGVIDLGALKKLYAGRGDSEKLIQEIFERPQNGPVVISSGNAGLLLNILWALGLSNKSEILERGPMTNGLEPLADRDTILAKVSNYASTGGWILARGNPMGHYSSHEFIVLDGKGKEKVERIAKTIYRPCCDNSTHFPDCNHGMAMLGLLQILVAQGKEDDEIYRTALLLNSYWFPDVYENIKTYIKQRKVLWGDIVPQQILGKDFSSSSSYGQILRELEETNGGSVGSCSV